ncbi:hypothetical protein M3196_08240 [Fictibacillus nanhaiensis]|uniref:hypothetical protein n=1 Tax=Fictibacillus nanhaiensis TaxID=742169 RepID=UPI0020408AF2|nr:hypothetical protein [Fictibacillus nanhaiensis]MCM3731649.1 hypothetical protein [Fictibacillus nanhaiensis]
MEILTTASSTKNVTNTTSVTGRKTTKRRESMTGNVNLLPHLVPTTARRTKRRNTTGNVNLLHLLPHLAPSTSSARSPERRSADTIAVIADTIASILGQKSCSVKKKESEVIGLLFLL